MSVKFNENNLFKAIFKHAHNGIAVVGLDGRWLKVNDSLCELLNYTKKELYKLSFQDITYKDDLELDLEHVNLLLKGAIEDYQIEKRYFGKNGNIIWVLLSVSLVKDSDGKPLYFISQLVDITERKNSEREIELFLSVIKNQNEKLKRIANIATHDLRTHISNLYVIFEFLKNDYKNLTRNPNFKMFENSLSNLSETINNLDDVKLASANQSLALKPLSLSKFVHSAIYNVNAIARILNCTIINNVDNNINVYGIEAYLDSIMLNFLTNAIKYKSDKRDLTIELSTELKGEYAILKIKDNGLGIDLKRHKNELFQFKKTFHQNKDSRGIGLFLTKQQVEILGGEIKVQSEVNKGTEFYIYLKKAS